MKIMFCVLCLSYGGAEKNLCFIANEMVERGHEVVICNLNTLPTVQKIDTRIKVIDVPVFSKRYVKRIQQIDYIRKVCKDERPDVMVSFLFMPNFLATVVGKLTGVPVIISERADPNRHTVFAERLIYFFYRFANGAVFQTNGAKKCFPKMLQRKSTVIPNPVMLKDPSLFSVYEDAEKSIVFCGRFEVVQKRQDIALEAFKVVHDKHPEYVLDFYGDGPDENAMKAYAQRLGLSGCVNFHGVSSNVLQDMARSELFMMSSDYEGIPNVLLEALSIGMPCVSTDCSPGGARMLIRDGDSGLIVPCGDAEALANAVCKMIEDRDFAISCGRNAVEVRERFSKQKILDAWESFMEKYAKGGKNKK